jgi:UDP-N-acetylmuramoyl-L-alanyl-D-glutamate--2,6-diaminopimelate ligase
MKKDFLKTFLQDTKQEIPTHLDDIINSYPYIFKSKDLKALSKKYYSVLENIFKQSTLPTKVANTFLKTLNEEEHDPVVIGITGTVGKTSVAYLLSEYLQALGKKVTLLSSASLYNPLSKISKNFCQPVPIKSHNFLKDFIQTSIDYNAEYIIIEVSEEAIKDNRIQNIPFDIKVLTHFWFNWKGDDEVVNNNYLNNKRNFFTSDPNVVTFANVSSEHLEYLTGNSCKVIYYGSSYNHNNIKKEHIQYSFNKLYLSLDKQYIEIQSPSKPLQLYTTKISSPSIATNICCVISILDYLNILNLDVLVKVINNMDVPGRKVIIRNNRVFVITLNYLNDIILYSEMLNNEKEIDDKELANNYFNTYNKIKVLTGFVGWKSSWKDIESNTLEEYAQYLKDTYPVSYNSHSKAFDIVDEYYLTNVNPGDFNKQVLMDYSYNIFKHSKKPITEISDRIKAIKAIIESSSPGDVIFISGRASFNQYEDSNDTLYFTDEEILLHTLEELEW